MKKKPEKLTPMMVQYRQVKEQNKDKVLFFRLGDFYEMFDEDAVEVSRLLNLTLTKRAEHPMCGIPYHAAKNYIKRLLDAGKKIAICEQLSLSDDSKQLARREVVQVVTPATVVDDDFLDAHSNSYVFCVCHRAKHLVFAYADITDGQFVLGSMPLDRQFSSLRTLLAQVSPREVLVNEDEYFTKDAFRQVIDKTQKMVTKLPSWYFRIKDGFSLLCRQVHTANLKAFALADDDERIAGGGALLRYLQDTAKTGLDQIRGYLLFSEQQCLQIDESSRRNLELLVNLQDGGSRYTLYDAIDATVTSGGSRLLKKWISYPLCDVDRILFRQQWVAAYVEDRQLLSRTRDILKSVLDLERLTSRLVMGRSHPRDLVGIAGTVHAFIDLVSDDAERYAPLMDEELSQQRLADLLAVVTDIEAAIDPACQGPFVGGQVIRDGYDSQLDSLRSIQANGKQLLDEYLDVVRKETGITTLKLSSNKILGHYLEVSKGQVEKVPASFYRKQTLVNAERYTSDELIACETKILRSAGEAEARERAVYETLVERSATMQDVLFAIGRFLCRVDCLQGFAKRALDGRYVRPIFSDDDCLEILGGRHPVVERQLGLGGFVANDLSIEASSNRFCLITGPNMAGKSTYLRQTALIVLLAQMGSFVPATSAKLGLVDRLFCRVGASDNLARGESTFLIEMQEAAYILRNATQRSLVIVDELGRGTSTQDGMSIAYAVMQVLLELGSKTLFATHYHELAQLDISRVQLLTLEVSQKGREIVFVRKVVPGTANSSYGLHVARMAGIPSAALKQAESFQKRHFSEYGIADPQLSLFASPMDDGSDSDDGRQLPILDAAEEQVLDSLRDFDVASSTPLEALAMIEQLQRTLETDR